jgi:hypothetical protein
MYAAKIVVRRKADGKYYAGFAKNVGAGETIKTFGSWYGSQMSYKPFCNAMQSARDLADSLNEAQNVSR